MEPGDESALQQTSSELKILDRCLEDLADNIPAVLFQSSIHVDGTGFQIQFISARTLELLGVESEEILRSPMAILELIEPEDLAKFIQLQVETAAEAAPFDLEIRFKTRQGQGKWVRISAQGRKSEHGLSEYHGIAIDITEQKRLLEELQNANERLGQLGDQQHRDLQIANEQLKKEIIHRKQVEKDLLVEQRLLRRLIDLQERERRLVAYDIHDGFVQDIVGSHLLLEGLRSKLKDPDEQVVEQLDTLRKILSKAINEGRRLISELRPMVIDEMGIIEAVKYLVDEEEAAGRLILEFDHDVKVDRLEPFLEGIVFRIVQESISNVSRHSGVDRAMVSIKQQDRELLIDVIDSGIGFDVDKIAQGHFGIEGIRERARLFGGKAVIVSAAGKGTHVHVQLPIESDEQ